MSTIVRRLVSRKKKRFVWNGFDLDLAYITGNIIAMGLPSFGSEAFYRNSAGTLVSFLDKRHGSAYKVYNLCSEKNRQYPADVFHGRVAYFPFDDHNPPPFALLQRFCDDVDEFMSHDERASIAVHCKAGKGRTGVMICAYLLHCNFLARPQESMDYYATTRTYNQKGLTIPSQRRYIHYFGRFVAQNCTLDAEPVRVASLCLSGLSSSVRKVKFKIYSMGGAKLLSTRVVRAEPSTTGHGRVAMVIDINSDLDNTTVVGERADSERREDDTIDVAGIETRSSTFEAVVGDFLVVAYTVGLGKGSSKKIGAAWMHSSFVPRDTHYVIPKECLDKAVKDKKFCTKKARLAVRCFSSSDTDGYERYMDRVKHDRAVVANEIVSAPVTQEFNDCCYPNEATQGSEDDELPPAAGSNEDGLFNARPRPVVLKALSETAAGHSRVSSVASVERRLRCESLSVAFDDAFDEPPTSPPTSPGVMSAVSVALAPIEEDDDDDELPPASPCPAAPLVSDLELGLSMKASRRATIVGEAAPMINFVCNDDSDSEPPEAPVPPVQSAATEMSSAEATLGILA